MRLVFNWWDIKPCSAQL